jgi:transposase
MLRVAVVVSVLTVFAAEPLGGLFALGTTAVVVLGWGYSAPPLRLKARAALDRTAPIFPMRPGLPEKATDYVRHGTTTLFAALEVATGKVTDACYPRHRHTEFLHFLKQVGKAYPRVRLHIVCDNYATHKHPSVQAWLAKNRRITMHFTPTSGSWLNMVEIFFGIITRQAIRRGTFTSVKDLITAIEIFIDGWNERCQPFLWTKTADEILTKATGGQRSSFTRH